MARDEDTFFGGAEGEPEPKKHLKKIKQTFFFFKKGFLKKALSLLTFFLLPSKMAEN
jgi:hypothetical protein